MQTTLHTHACTWQPNIDSDGRICLDTLKMQPQGSWAPAVNLNTLLLTIRVLLAYPNPADGLVADIVSPVLIEDIFSSFVYCLGICIYIYSIAVTTLLFKYYLCL